MLEAAWAHGARRAGYVLLRLPWEVKDIFKDWLERHYPLKAKHVMSRVHQMRGGRDNDPCFGSRMVGTGELADLLESASISPASASASTRSATVISIPRSSAFRGPGRRCRCSSYRCAYVHGPPPCDMK